MTYSLQESQIFAVELINWESKVELLWHKKKRGNSNIFRSAQSKMTIFEFYFMTDDSVIEYLWDDQSNLFGRLELQHLLILH